MRMIMVVIVMIATILATAVTGYIVAGISDQFMTMAPRSTNPNANSTYVRLDNIIVDAHFPWLIMLGGIIGLILWALLQSQNREVVTGRY